MPDLHRHQQGLVDQIAQDLHTLIPDGFDAATARFRVLTGLGQIEGIASCSDGTTLVFSGFGDQTIEAIKQLRQAMYTPQTGAWFSGSITVTRRGYADSQFSYDEEPRWTREVTGDDYARDLAVFPRERVAVPDWLAALLPAGVTFVDPQSAAPEPTGAERAEPEPTAPEPAATPATALAPSLVSAHQPGATEPALAGPEPDKGAPAPARVVAWVDQVVALDWPMTLAELAQQAPALGWSVATVTRRQASFTTEEGLLVEARARDDAYLTRLTVRLAGDETGSHEENRALAMTYLGALRGHLGPEERFEHPKSPSLSRTWIPPHHVQIHLSHEDGQVSAGISLIGLMWLQEREERRRRNPTRPVPPSTGATWDDLQQALTEVAVSLPVGSYLVVRAPGRIRCAAQLAVHQAGLTAELIGDGLDSLDTSAQQRCADLGFAPADDIPGWRRQLTVSQRARSAAEVAEAFVVRLRDLGGTAAPHELVYEAWNDHEPEQTIEALYRVGLRFQAD